MNNGRSGHIAPLLALLSDTQREVLRLRLVACLTVEETAAMLGATAEEVRTAQNQALYVLHQGVIAPRRGALRLVPALPPETKPDE